MLCELQLYTSKMQPCSYVHTSSQPFTLCIISSPPLPLLFSSTSLPSPYPAPLAAIFLWATLALPPVAAITCYSNNACPSSDDSVCQFVCPEKFHFCSAFYRALPTGGLEPFVFGCLDDPLNKEVPDTCSISEISPGQLGCFCNTSLCNNIGVPITTTPLTPTPSTPTPAPGSAPVVTEKPTVDPSECDMSVI